MAALAFQISGIEAGTPEDGSAELMSDHGALIRKEERALELCEAMIDISAALFNVSSKEIRVAGRSRFSVSRVRQVAMYVAHVTLRLNMAEVGRGFGRDRKTVQYACGVIEDLREDPDFDHIVAQTERVALAALRNRISG